MMFILLLASAAIGIASDVPRNGAQSLRLPIKNSGSSTIETRVWPPPGLQPLRANATQKYYLSPYTVELSVGTPAQLVYPALDLFANTLWLNPDCYSSLSLDACCANGYYNPNASTSALDLGCTQLWEFSNSYSGASGCYVVDELHFSGAWIDHAQVGIANESWGQSAGRLGLGFGCEAEGDISIVKVLKSQGLIAKSQFSIALGSANPTAGPMEATTDVGLGELLFSGINTRKFAGELRKMYSHPAPEGDPRYYVTLTAIGFFDPSNCVFWDVYQPATRAFFDYTTIMSYLPATYTQTISEFFPDATFNYTEGLYEVPCYYRSREASVDFYFDTLIISVPLRDFILQVAGICYLGVVENSEDEAILGQTFLRAAYTAFDLDENAIYMAQYENCGDEPIDWDPSASEEEGVCAPSPSTIPASCYMTATSPGSTSTTHSTSHSTTSSNNYPTSRSSSSHSTSSSSTSTSHSSTRSSTHSTTSTRSSSTKHSSTSSKRTSSTSSSTHSTYWPRITSTSIHSSTTRTSSHKPSSSRPRSSSTTESNHITTTSPWSSGFPSGGTSVFWSQPTTGFSWSNVSFTPGSTSRRTPKPTSTLTSLPASTNRFSETSTLTSLPASTSTSSHRSPSFRSGSRTVELKERSITVTVGVLTSTVFMPSPITVPDIDCKCAEAVTVTREPENGVLSCDAVTEYRTVSHCRDAEHTAAPGLDQI